MKTMRYFILLIISFNLDLLGHTLCYAQQTPIDNGVSYLRTTQSSDGSWGSNADIAVLDTSTVIDTLRLLNISDVAYSNGVAWLSS